MVDLKKLANEIAALSPSEAKELQNITEEYFENGIPLTEEELIKLSHDRLYKNTQGRGIAILTAYKNSASDEDNIKANHRLHFECKLGYYVWKIETYDDVRRANELFSSENHVNVSNSPYILEGIAQLVVGPRATLPTELDDDGNPVDSFVKKIVTPEKAERKILSNIKGFRSDMIYHGKMFEQDKLP